MNGAVARAAVVGGTAIAAFVALEALAAEAQLDGVMVTRSISPHAWSAVAVLLTVGALLLLAKAEQRPVRSRALSLASGALLAIVVIAALSASHRLCPDARYLPGAERKAESLPLPDGGEALFLPAARAPRAVVVVVHGTGNDRLFGLWRFLDGAHDARLAVLTANLPGHGVGGTDSFTLDACRRRLDALASVARTRSRGAPVVLVGQSLGAALVLDAWARGLPVDGAVSVSAPLEVRVGAGLLRELGALAHAAVWSTLRYGTLAEVLPAAGSFRRSEFPVRVTEPGSYVDAVARAAAAMALPERLRDKPRTANAPPILLVHGRDDGVVPFAQAEVLATALGDRASLLFPSGIHHLDPLFDERTLAAILDWISALGAAGADGER